MLDVFANSPLIPAQAGIPLGLRFRGDERFVGGG
jgi:hypothetical protein